MKLEKTVNIDGTPFVMSSDDVYLENMGEEFEPYMVRLFKGLINKDARVVDVGANIGFTALLFGMHAYKVVCFEASPSTYRLLSENVEASGLKNIKTHNLALGSRKGQVPLTFAENNRSGGFVSDITTVEKGHITEVVDVERLDDVYESDLERVDFVKLDVEGYELEVIEGMGKLLERFRPVVALELNHWCLNVFRRITVPEYLDRLRAVFPYLYAVDPGSKAMNLHDPDEAYAVMHEHVVRFRYATIVGGYDAIHDRLDC